MNRLSFQSFLIILIISSNCLAHGTKSTIKLTLYDSPFSHLQEKYNAPSMDQALNATISFYNYSHKELKEMAKEKEHYPALYELAFDILWAQFPLGISWLHEEYHRAVLSHAKISSHNDVYYWKFSEVIAVSHLTDEE